MREKALKSPISNLVLILAMLLSSFASLRPTQVVKADHTANPSSVVRGTGIQAVPLHI
jgi:hypothetical protein